MPECESVYHGKRTNPLPAGWKREHGDKEEMLCVECLSEELVKWWGSSVADHNENQPVTITAVTIE